MAALPGCVASAEGGFVADYPAEYVASVPPRIEYYPRTYYRGNPAYLVEGRWYYRTHDRWVVFREEPSELHEYRVRQAGPAYLAPQNRYGRGQERQIAERRAEQHREAERRAEEDRRRARAQAQRAEEQRRFEQQREAQQRAEEQRRFEQQREAQQRADADRRLAERRGRATRKRDRSHGDQQDTRDERDRRHYRQD